MFAQYILFSVYVLEKFVRETDDNGKCCLKVRSVVPDFAK